LSKSVLILDEDPEVLTFLTQLLEARKLRVLRARSKSEAFEILNRAYVPVDLVVANLMLTGVGGPDFTRHVADLRPHVPVMYMSAFIDSGVIRVEAMSGVGYAEFPGADDRGVMKAVFSALKNSEAWLHRSA